MLVCGGEKPVLLLSPTQHKSQSFACWNTTFGNSTQLWGQASWARLQRLICSLCRSRSGVRDLRSSHIWALCLRSQLPHSRFKPACESTHGYCSWPANLRPPLLWFHARRYPKMFCIPGRLHWLRKAICTFGCEVKQDNTKTNLEWDGQTVLSAGENPFNPGIAQTGNWA